MQSFKKYIVLMRLHRPIGVYLLLWPSFWSLAINNFFNQPLWNSSLYKHSDYLIFLLGTVLMRSAGCVLNDLADRSFDIQVERTKNRPLAAGTVSVSSSLLLILILLIASFLIFLKLPLFNKLWAIYGLLLAVIYPYFKRFTYWPQLVLGMGFNSGVMLAISQDIFLQKPMAVVFLYMGGIFWTLAYDTIYAFQDISDDRKIGLKSTAIYFSSKPKLAVSTFYLLSSSSFITSWYLFGFDKFNMILYGGIIFLLSFWLVYQWQPDDRLCCLKIFKLNQWIGCLIWLSLALSFN